MIYDKIKCCSLLDRFVQRYRNTLSMELTRLGDGNVLEVRGLLHVETDKGLFSNASCGSGCVSCGPSTPTPENKYETVPLELVWKVCPYCGGNFVREDL